MHPKLRAIMGGFALLAMAATGTAAQTPTEWKFASSGQPRTVFANHIERMATEINALSKGTLKIDVFMGSQLGGEGETIQQVMRGRVEMGGFSLTTIAQVLPEVSILTLPFLFKSGQQIDCVVDSAPMVKYLTDALAAKNLHLYGWSALGTVHFAAKKPILSPDDVRGIKARAQATKVGAIMWATFGANPIPLAITEWSSAHQTGLVEVSDAPPTYYHISGLGKIAPVLTLSAHQQLAAFILVNKSLYEKLTPEQKAAFDTTRTTHPYAKLSVDMRAFEDSMLEAHKKGGGQVVTMTPEQRTVWQKGLEPQFAKIVQDVGGEAPKLWALVQDAMKSCGG